MPLKNENDVDFNSITESNLNRIQNTVSKVGYSDGITDGRESVFQKGFDCGYENGLLTGFELAKYKAFYEVIEKASATENFQLENEVYKELNIPEAKDKSHFMEDGSSTIELSTNQQDYINQRKSLFAKDLPIATSLFSR